MKRSRPDAVVFLSLLAACGGEAQTTTAPTQATAPATERLKLTYYNVDG